MQSEFRNNTVVYIGWSSGSRAVLSRTHKEVLLCAVKNITTQRVCNKNWLLAYQLLRARY